jgi:hypothetical protein
MIQMKTKIVESSRQTAISIFQSAISRLERGDEDDEAMIAARLYEALAYHNVDRFSAKELLEDIESKLRKAI